MDIVADLLGGGRTIAYKTDLAHLCGSVTAGLLLSQLWYYTNQATVKERDGWFWKTAEELKAETGMGRYELEKARKTLKGMGLLQEELRGVPATIWYRLDKERLYALLHAYAKGTYRGGEAVTAPTNQFAVNQQTENAVNQQTGLVETSKPDCYKPADKVAIKPESIPENHRESQRQQQQTPQATDTENNESVVVSSASLVGDLVAQGVTKAVALKLIETHGESACRVQLDALPRRKCTDPAATLVSAIREEWEVPQPKRQPPRPQLRVATSDRELAHAVTRPAGTPGGTPGAHQAGHSFTPPSPAGAGGLPEPTEEQREAVRAAVATAKRSLGKVGK